MRRADQTHFRQKLVDGKVVRRPDEKRATVSVSPYDFHRSNVAGRAWFRLDDEFLSQCSLKREAGLPSRLRRLPQKAGSRECAVRDNASARAGLAGEMSPVAQAPQRP